MSMVHSEFSVKSGGNYSYFMFKRFIRIYPLYISVYIITILLVRIHSGNTESPLPFLINSLLLQSAFGFNYIPSAWSISTELFAYLAFPIMLAIISNTRNIIPVTVLAVASLIYISVNNEILAFSVNTSSGLTSILRCLADYSLGVTSFVLFKNGHVINKTTSYLFVVFVGILLMYRTVDIYIILLCAAIIPSLVETDNLVAKALSCRPIHYLGQISYSLYLIHSVLINQLAFFFNEIHYGKNAIIFLSSIILSCITYHLIEKPSRNWLSRFGSLFKTKTA